MENSDPHTGNDSNGSAADNDGHIFGEELAHKKEDNGEMEGKQSLHLKVSFQFASLSAADKTYSMPLSL